MLVSFRRLSRKMTDQFVSCITRASFNSCVGLSHKMEVKPKPYAVSSNDPHDTIYEDAVKALHNLQSNAESIAKARQNLHKKVGHNIPNMMKYIIRSGLTMKDVDKLSVIHVSGTKGKGSTCAFCERILYFHGYKTGLFTSPHMIEVRERIRINGRPISQELFSKHFWKVYNSLQMTQTETGVGAEDGGGMPPYFAFLTVLSLHVFLSEGVDVAVVEVGIGGQYDSTNFFRKPVVCGVTSLGLDHTAILGNTITEIAWNKAGIFKPGCPAVTVQHERAALEVLLKRSHEIQNPLYIAKEMTGELIEKQNIKLGIAGAKQAENASLAIQLCRMWEHAHITGSNLYKSIPNDISSIEEIPQLEVSELDEATVKGISSCVWPGRAQTVHRGDITYYLDGAHTKESMEVCVQWFKDSAQKEMKYLGGKKCTRILLFNATSDRDVGPLLASLVGCNFDAALFCTNLLSVVESFNRADQLNKTVTSRYMMEKVETSKSTWDELIAKVRLDLAVTKDCEYNGECQLETYFGKMCHNSHSDTSDANSSRILLEHNPNSTHSELTKEKDEHEINHGKKFKVPHSTLVDSQTDSICQSAGQVRRISSTTNSNFTEDHMNMIKATDQKNMLRKMDHRNNILKETDYKNMLKKAEISVIAQNVSSGKNGKINKLLPHDTLLNHNTSSTDSNSGINPALSLKFSCILHALAWATQGRDPSVKVNDPEFVVPFIPRDLCDADHIQILVTGSLHLVGGVLGVVDPQMND